MDPDKPRVIIVGGGFAGVAAARALRKAEANVVVVDKHNHHLFQPLLYQVATAALHPGTIAAPIRSVVSGQKNCRVLMNEVKSIDLEAREIELDDEPYTFDYLVVAAGFETNYFGNDDWKKFAPGLKTIDEATDVRARFLLAFEQAEFEQDKAAKRAALTFAKSVRDHAFAGSWRRDRHEHRNPEPEPGRPRKPEALSSLAAAKWDELSILLDAEGRLTASDGPWLELAADAYAEYVQWRALAGDRPLDIPDADRQAHIEMRKAWEAYRKLLADAGLLATTRPRVRLPAVAAAPDDGNWAGSPPR